MATLGSLLNQSGKQASERKDKLKTRKDAEMASRQQAKAERDRKKEEKKQNDQAEKAAFKNIRRLNAEANPERHSRLADTEARHSEARSTAKAMQTVCEHGFVNCRVCRSEYRSPRAGSQRGARAKIAEEILRDDDELRA